MDQNRGLGMAKGISLKVVKNGSTQPVFAPRCPVCSSRICNWSPVTNGAVKEALEELPRFDVFLFDRPKRGILTLAEHARAHGNLGH